MPPSIQPPSNWITRFADLVPKGGPVLDLACGGGRHTRFFANRQHEITAVDINVTAVAGMPGKINCIEADLEQGPWPLAGRTFAGVIITNYLWRPLFPDIAAAVAPGGALLYETFGRGNEKYGRPSNPDYLLAPGELLFLTEFGFQIIAYEHGIQTNSDTSAWSVISRIAAVRDDELRTISQ